MLEVIDHGPIRELQIAHPPVNALRPQVLATLREALEAAPGEGARAIVVSGAPGFFSAGLDVPFMLEGGQAVAVATFEELFALDDDAEVPDGPGFHGSFAPSAPRGNSSFAWPTPGAGPVSNASFAPPPSE